MGGEVWSGGEDRLVVSAVREEAPGVVTFALVAESGRRFAFRPGQYVTIAVPLAEAPQWRCFTISSAPAVPDRIDLTIKRQGAGGATDWLHRHAGIGTAMAARPIGGVFCLAAPPAGPLALVSAGSGATPMISMLRWLDAVENAGPVDYLHLARGEDELLFRGEVEAIAARRPDVTVRWLVSGRDGRPSAGSILSALPQIGGAEVYCCGPAGFMDTVRSAHREAGGRPQHFFEESFGAPPVDEMVAMAPDIAGGHPVTIEPAGVTFAAPPGETLLVSAAKAGIVIPSSCRQGLCATCRVTKVSGEAEMQQNGGLFDDEVEAGDILACCTYPRSPLTIRL